MRFFEFISFILLVVISFYTILIGRYRHALVGRKRALYGLAAVGLILCLNRLMLLFGIVGLDVVVAYTGIAVFGIIWWVVSEAKGRLR